MHKNRANRSCVDDDFQIAVEFIRSTNNKSTATNRAITDKMREKFSTELVDGARKYSVGQLFQFLRVLCLSRWQWVSILQSRTKSKILRTQLPLSSIMELSHQPLQPLDNIVTKYKLLLFPQYKSFIQTYQSYQSTRCLRNQRLIICGSNRNSQLDLSRLQLPPTMRTNTLSPLQQVERTVPVQTQFIWEWTSSTWSGKTRYTSTETRPHTTHSDRSVLKMTSKTRETHWILVTTSSDPPVKATHPNWTRRWELL